MQNKDVAQEIANQIYSLRDVKDVGVDLEQRKLFVQSTNGAVLSPWALAIAAERAQGKPVAIAGPFGVLMIERFETADPATATKPCYSHRQGEVR